MIRKMSLLFTLLAAASLLLAACGPQEDAPSPQDPAGEVPGSGPDGELMEIGAQVYQDQCASCHAPDGSGLPPSFPPLDGNGFVIGNPIPVIDVVVHGRNAMPPFGGILTDQEIAGVITFIRGSWTNMASPIEVEAVQANR
jgi:mono/diheme cytochrome c family protein